MDLEAMKAAFLAKGGEIKTAPVGIAYGVNAEADKAKRAEAREQARYERVEHAAENRFQRGVEENGYYKS